MNVLDLFAGTLIVLIVVFVLFTAILLASLLVYGAIFWESMEKLLSEWFKP